MILTLTRLNDAVAKFFDLLPTIVFVLSIVRGIWLWLEDGITIWVPKTAENIQFWRFWHKVLQTLDWLSMSWQRIPRFPRQPPSMPSSGNGLRLATILLCAVLIAGQTACDSERKATDQFTRSNYLVSLYLGEGLNVINSLLDLGQISPDAATKAAIAFRAANTVQGALLTESVKYLKQGEGGAEYLEITEAGQLRLQSLLESLNDAVVNATNDPSVPLDAETKTRIRALATAIRPLVSQMISAVQRLKVATKDAPNLRMQIGPQTQVNLRQLQQQLTINETLFAEVSRGH